MAKLDLDEIRPGLVSHLDQTILTKDPNIIDTSPQINTELRPFVCISEADGRSTWVPLTSRHRRERVKIKDEWRQGGIDMWRDRVCYVNDGANVYIGPNASFADASTQEQTNRDTRSQMSAEGLKVVILEVSKQRHRRTYGKDV